MNARPASTLPARHELPCQRHDALSGNALCQCGMPRFMPTKEHCLTAEAVPGCSRPHRLSATLSSSPEGRWHAVCQGECDGQGFHCGQLGCFSHQACSARLCCTPEGGRCRVRSRICMHLSVQCSALAGRKAAMLELGLEDTARHSATPPYDASCRASRRSHQYYVQLFERAGLRMMHTALQRDFPKGLFKGESAVESSCDCPYSQHNCQAPSWARFPPPCSC